MYIQAESLKIMIDYYQTEILLIQGYQPLIMGMAIEKYKALESEEIQSTRRKPCPSTIVLISKSHMNCEGTEPWLLQ
jgi:hypothetical protein